MRVGQLIVVVMACAVALSANAQDRPGFDLPQGEVTGTLTRHDTGEPIGRQWLTLKQGRWSRSASTDTFGRFAFKHVPAGASYQLSFHNNGYKVRTHGPVRVENNGSVEVAFKAHPVDPQVAPYTYSDTYLPGQNITVMVRSIRVTDVSVDVFRYSSKEVAQRRGALIDRKRLTIDADHKPILSYRQPVTNGHQLSWRTTKVQPAFNDPGFYVVRVSGAGSTKLIPIFVTRLSLITKRTPTGVWVWATDLESGQPIKGVTVSGEATVKKDSPARALLKSKKTNNDGLVEFKGKHAQRLRYWGRNGNQMAYVDTTPPSSAQALAFRTYVYTDRPAYRPGDEVQYKIITRANEDGVYRVTPDEPWQVWIRDADGEVIHRASHKTNMFGTFHGSFTVGSASTLGSWSVEAKSGDKTQAGRFKVLEYRKPEYVLNVATGKKQYVQGTPIEVTFQANYYFGAPVRGQTVSWTVYETPFRPWWYDRYYGDSENEVRGYGQVAHSGTAVLDDKGRATISIDVDRASIDRWVTIEGVVSDATNREVSARHKVMVTRGTFQVGLRGNGKIFQVGETASFELEARRFDGKPSVHPLTVTTSLESFSNEHKIWLYKTLETKTLKTDGDGKANYSFKVKHDGFIRVEVKGKDKYGNPIVQSSFIWATKNKSIAGGYKKKSLDILTDKTAYKPGETARVLINTNRNNPWVLFSVEGDGVFEPRVVHVDGNSRMFEVPLKARHAPNVYLSVAFAAGKQFYSLQKSVNVSPAHKLVDVNIEADKRVYEPGETAGYTIAVTDHKGKPVQSELSVGLVDSAVYAISAELAPKIGSFFYGHRPNPVRTAYSFPSRYLGGADKDELDAGDGVRRDFKDTAFWKAVVTTDERGIAHVKVPLPDNLTTWRLTVRAVTQDTLVGAKTHEIQTSKDLISTLALPRFLRRGDRVEVVSMIHNRGEKQSAVTTELSASGSVTVEGNAGRSEAMAAATSTSYRWPIAVAKAASTGLMAIFKVATSAGKLNDAEERRIPVQAVAVDRLQGVSGMASVSTTQQFEIPSDSIDGTAKLRVRLSGSLAGAVVESLGELATFPYGCTEQTMNSFLPDLVAEKVLKKLGVARSGELAKLDAMVRTGLSRLYGMQRGDGGFGWWPDDSSRPFMTAYVVYGFARAQSLGWTVREGRYKRAIVAAMKHYDTAGDWNTRAFIAYALAHTPKNKQLSTFLAKVLPELRKNADGLNAYSVATAALAHVAVGEKAAAKPLTDRLRKMVVEQGSWAYFPGRDEHYSWTDNDKETTAYALRALLAVNPADPIIPKAVRWLMQRRRGGMWDTTKDTAAALEALTEVIEKSGELKSNYVATLLVNGQSAGTLKVTPDTVMRAVNDIEVPVAMLKKGENDIAVNLNGSGTVYWSGELRFGGAPVATNEGITVTREYYKVGRLTELGKTRTTFEPIDEVALTIGDEVEVRLALSSKHDMEYVIVEDPLPAGYEVIPKSLSAGFSRREVRDDKVAFFATRLGGGTRKLTYRMRAEMAGAVSASPAVARMMYMPEMMGSSDKKVVTTGAPAAP